MSIRYVLIGCGGHGLDHIPSAAQAGMTLVGVHDPKRPQMEEAARLSGTDPRLFDSVEALLDWPEYEAGVVVSPDRDHAWQALELARRKRHVFVDKPAAVTVADLQMLRQTSQLAAQHGLQLSTCHPRYFDPPYRWMHEQMPRLAEQYGPLRHVELDFSYPAPSMQWKQGSRSLLLDHFPHEIHYLRWLLGRGAFTATRLRDSYNHYAVAGAFDTGVTFMVQGTRDLRPRPRQWWRPRRRSRIYPETIRFRFGRATCELNTHTGMVHHYDHGRQTIKKEQATKTDYDVRLAGPMQDFARSIATPQPGYVSADDLWVITHSAVTLADSALYRYSAQ